MHVEGGGQCSMMGGRLLLNNETDMQFACAVACSLMTASKSRLSNESMTQHPASTHSLRKTRTDIQFKRSASFRFQHRGVAQCFFSFVGCGAVRSSPHTAQDTNQIAVQNTALHAQPSSSGTYRHCSEKRFKATPLHYPAIRFRPSQEVGIL